VANILTNSISSMDMHNPYSPNNTIRIKYKILLVEDNPGDARLVEIFLSESEILDCEIVNKTSLRDAIQALDEHNDFEAVLLDLTLPDSRGFETLEQLMAKHPNMNIIVLTGLSDKGLGLKAVQAGAQDFLIKGAFDTELLAKSIRYSIERNKSKHRLEETQRLAHIGSWEYNPINKHFEASEETFRILGFNPAEQHQAIEQLSNKNSSLYVLNEIHAKAEQSGVYKKDVEIFKNNSELRVISVQCKMTANSSGGNVFQGIVQDVTERKRAEREMVKSQERYQDIFTNSRDAIYICTLDGKFIDFNQATLDLFDFTKEELMNLPDAHKLYYPTEKKNEFLLKLRSQKAVKDFEIDLATKKEEIRNCLVSASILATDDFIGYNCIVRDLTERKQADKLRKARDLARQSAEMKEQFIASVSHEMRTPMNAILGMSNILVQMDLKGEQMDMVTSIKQSSEILLGIVNDILEISSIQNGKIKFEEKVFNIKELLDNLMNVMQYKAKEKDLYFQVDMDPSIPKTLNGDPLRLNQILFNLVGNAIKFTDNGWVKIKVEKLHDIMDSVMLKFTVEDTGIGIPSDKLEAIFDSFTRIRTKERLFEGTGLGLSIAKNLVELQGGKINVESELGKGSKFYFDLLLEIGDEDADQNDGREAIDFDDDSHFKLLLVEDNKLNQMVAKKTLTRKFVNMELTLAENGQEAVDAMTSGSFDIVLMDIQMPIMDGYEATKIIRQMRPDIASTKVLAMTAHAHISKDKSYLEHGMDDFVLKPFEPEDLFYKVRKYVKK